MESLLSMSLSDLSKLLHQREVSPVEIVEKLLERINEIDPILNTYITIDHEQLLQEAKVKEKDFIGKDTFSPLHGIPVGIKDNIYTKDLKTTMGSKIYENHVPKQDAYVVERLKKSGAMIIGKQNIHEFAYGPTGDRSHVGPVRNPYHLEKMSGGSSGGSAAALAACLCYGALGTDTSGSIRIPASFCGIVGMKPTAGTVSNRGVYPLAWNLDHVGPMTRTVEDNALLLNEIAYHDPEDSNSVTRKKEDFTRLIGMSIKGKKIGIPMNTLYYENIDKEIFTHIQNVIDLLESSGASVEYVELPHLESYIQAQRTIIRCEAYTIHEENLLIFSNLYDEEVKERLYTGNKIKASEYIQALNLQEVSRNEFTKVLDRCDVIITPTMAILPPDVGERYTTADQKEENHIRWTITKLTAATNLNGLPSLSVPCGFSKNGLPIGVQLIGKAYSEAILYQFGAIIEKSLSLNTALINIDSSHLK